MDWGVCYLNLRWERARGHLFYFPRWFWPQWHPFFNMPKLMSKFLKWVAKFAIRRCTSYTDSQESVYLIAKKIKKFVKFTNNCIVGILLKISSFVLLLSLLLLIFQFFQVASWPCFWKESNIGLCTQ